MTIAHLAGNRATGTASDRAGLTTYSAKSWVELGRVTLSATGDTMDLTGLDTSDYPYIQVLHHATYTGDTNSTFQCNNDTGNNYAQRNSYSGSSDSNNTSRANFTYADSSVHDSLFAVSNMNNIADQEKLIISHQASIGSTGAGNVPARAEQVGKWANTSSTITSMKHTQTNSGSYTSGTEFVVLGAKSSGTNTDKAGFWQELASVDLSGGAGDDLDVTFTAKKYLYLQWYCDATGGAIGIDMTFNGDTGTNYTRRVSPNGGSDATGTSMNEWNLNPIGTNTVPTYGQAFIINKSDKEKLGIVEHMSQGTAGASTAPQRIDGVYKWANTSAQINDIDIHNDQAGSYNTTSFLKVWGAD